MPWSATGGAKPTGELMRPGGWTRWQWLSLSSLLVFATALVLAALVQPVSRADRDEPVSLPAAVSPADVGKPAQSQARTQRPESIRLPSGVSMPVDVVATGRDGVLDLPSDIDRAGWWDGGSKIGDPYGAIVLAAHVDSVTEGIGPFAQLLGTRPGQQIRVAGSGSAQTFEVASVRLKPRASLSERAPAFSVYGNLRLVLITCAGPYDADGGGYRDNLIVVAKPLGGPRSLGH